MIMPIVWTTEHAVLPQTEFVIVLMDTLEKIVKLHPLLALLMLNASMEASVITEFVIVMILSIMETIVNLILAQVLPAQ